MIKIFIVWVIIFNDYKIFDVFVGLEGVVGWKLMIDVYNFIFFYIELIKFLYIKDW